MAEPMLTKSSMDIEEPSREIPYKDRAEPQRM
jgi:hypothetical protein